MCNVCILIFDTNGQNYLLYYVSYDECKDAEIEQYSSILQRLCPDDATTAFTIFHLLEISQKGLWGRMKPLFVECLQSCDFIQYGNINMNIIVIGSECYIVVSVRVLLNTFKVALHTK